MQQAIVVNGTSEQCDWNGVNWRKQNQIVRNLRQRIFRASKENDLKKSRIASKTHAAFKVKHSFECKTGNASKYWQEDGWRR